MPGCFIDAREMPELVELYEQQGPTDFDLVSIAISNTVSDEKWMDQLWELGMSWPLHLNALREHYADLKVHDPITATPRFVVLTKDGIMAGVNIRRVADLAEVLKKVQN